SVTLNWLLFDLGGRSGDIDEAEHLLTAANLNQNVAIQDLVLRVEQAYFQYQGTKSLLEASKTTVKEAQTGLEAANERRKAGVATVSDVLLAKTRVSQAELTLQQVEGDVAVARGALATSLGVPANLPVDASELRTDVPLRPLVETVDKLIARA